MTEFVVPTPKKRLDLYLSNQHPDISRSFLQKLCNTDQVLVNGQPEKSGFRLKPSDKVEIVYDMASIAVTPDIELPVLYEDDDVLVINKPDGVISHARGKFYNEASVASFVRQKTKQSGDRAGIVHRLDRATSGVMVVAKHQEALSWLQQQFADRKVTKTYQAIVSGHLKPADAVIDMPIERNPKAPSSFRVGTGGRAAQTEYHVLTSPGGYDLVELHPMTGRTHQLRVHLKQVGHPIVGDQLYDGEPADRLYLHALSLELRLPSSQLKTFTAPLPEEFFTFQMTHHD